MLGPNSLTKMPFNTGDQIQYAQHTLNVVIQKTRVNIESVIVWLTNRIKTN